MIGLLIGMVAAAWTDLMGGIIAYVLAAPFLFAAGQSSFRLLDSVLP